MYVRIALDTLGGEEGGGGGGWGEARRTRRRRGGRVRQLPRTVCEGQG